MKKISTKIIDFVIIPLLLIVILILYFGLPKYSGIIKINRDYNSITIKRDGYGRPIIEGKTISDAFYGLGYAQGQDRLWQIYFKKMLISGRLSEIYGENYLDFDKYLRVLSITRYSNYSFHNLNQETQKSIQAFCDGINDAAESYYFYPLEFYINKARWEKYTPIDYISITKFFSLAVSKDISEELLRSYLDEKLDEELADLFLPTKLEDYLWKSVVVNDGELKLQGMYQGRADKWAEQIVEGECFEGFPEERTPYTPSNQDKTLNSKQKTKNSNKEVNKKNKNPENDIDFSSIIDEVDGSNVFVIHGNYTMTGKPMLASDPHFQKVIPTTWYPCSISFEENYISGAVIAGTAVSLVGRTKYISWGVAVSYVDTADLFDLTTRDDDEYFYDGKWRKLQGYAEKIFIKGIVEPVEITVYESHHGIVLDNYQPGVLSGSHMKPSEGKRYALAWSGYFRNDTFDEFPIDLLRKVISADDMISILAKTIRPALSVVFATEQGDIGYSIMGRIPKRRKPESSRRPQDGSKKENDWLGFIPFEHHPRIINPAKGYIIDANTKPVSDNTKFMPGANVQLSARQARIEELILNHIHSNLMITTEDVMRMQVDSVDILARKVIPNFFNAYNEAKRIQLLTDEEWSDKIVKMLRALKRWNFKVRRESVEASIFNVWLMFYNQFLMSCHNNLTEKDRSLISNNNNFDNFVFKKVFSLTKESHYGNRYCLFDEDVDIEDMPCLYGMINAFALTWEYLETTLGEDINNWEWGKIQTRHYMHSLSETPLRFLFHKSAPAIGNGRTVSLSLNRFDDETIASYIGPTLRFIAHMDEDNPSYLILDTGTSGIFTSPHYADQYLLFERDEWIELPLPSSENWINLLEIEMRE